MGVHSVPRLCHALLHCHQSKTHTRDAGEVGGESDACSRPGKFIAHLPDPYALNRLSPA